VSPVATLYFRRRDLEKGRARATRLLFAIGVDPRLDYLPGVRAVSKISPFCGPVSLRSEKRSRDPLRQVIVISHLAIRAMCRGSSGPSRRLRSLAEPLYWDRAVST
jgi:hypothetical protein